LSELESGKFSLVNFYERRARRILPALFAVMAVCIPFAWVLMKPAQLTAFAKSLIATNLFSSNFLFWKETGYFGAESEAKPLLHTWSLAVEEQYYILFPILLIVLWRFGFKPLFYTIIAIALVSLALSEWGWREFPTANFFLAPTRIWELLFGSICAFIAHNKELKPNEMLSLAGILLVLMAIFLFDDSTPFPSLFALAPVVGTSLLLLYGGKGTLVGKILSNRIFVGVGLISYSAYLWHQPVFAFARISMNGILDDWLKLALSLASLVLAYFSWKYVEQPFRRKKHKASVSRPFIFKASAFCVTLFVVLGFSGIQTNGFKDFYIKTRLSAAEARTLKLVDQHTQYNMYNHMVDDGGCKFWDQKLDDALILRFQECAKKYKKAVVVLGDSHAMNLYNIVAKSDTYPFIFGLAQGGCRPHKFKRKCQYEAFDDFLKSNSDKIKTVLFHQSGAYFVEDSKGAVDSARVYYADNPYKFNDRNIDLVTAYVKRISKSVNTLWVGPFVEAQVDFNDYDKFLNNFHMNEKSIRIYEELDDYIDRRIQPLYEPGVFGYLSLVDAFKLKKDFLKVGECITYMNVDHFSRCGENILARMIAPALKNSLR